MLLIPIFILIIGLSIIIYKLESIPNSISEIVYYLPNKFFWIIWIWIITFTTAPNLINSLEGSTWQFLGFLTITTLIFCGAMPLVKKTKNIVHYILGILAGIFSQLCVLILCYKMLLIWLLIIGIGIIIIFNKSQLDKIYNYIENKRVFILEIISAITLYSSILIT